MEELVKIVSIIKDGGWGIAAIAFWWAYQKEKRANILADKQLEVIVNVTTVLTSVKTLIEQQQKGSDG